MTVRDLIDTLEQFDEDMEVRIGMIQNYGSNFAMNIIVIKCFAGMANAACAAIDSMSHDEILGTIAGDDTIFILCRTEEIASSFTNKLRNMLNA